MTRRFSFLMVTLAAARLLLAAGLLLTAELSHAAVFQFSVAVETRKGERVAFLWVPHEALKICGIVVGGMTLMERELAKDARIRRACTEQDLAIVFLKCGVKGTDLTAAIERTPTAESLTERC